MIYFIFKVLLWLALMLTCANIVPAQEMRLSNPDIKKEEDCRVKPEMLKPTIDFDNPFFYNLKYDPIKHVQKAMMSPERELVIEQFGCLRLHTQFFLNINQPQANPSSLSFYANELFTLLDRVHYKDPLYPSYREDLENAIAKLLQEKGLRTKITLPLLEFNYLFYLDGNKNGATIILEIIKYVHEQNIQMPGIKEYLDDGYFKPQKN